MSIIEWRIPYSSARQRLEPRQRHIDTWRDGDLEHTLVQNPDGTYEVHTRCLITGAWLVSVRLW